MCIFQVDLFSAKGPMPETIFDVAQREKEIRYSSRTRLNTDSSARPRPCAAPRAGWRSEEHTSELQSLMRISYAVFCLKKKKKKINQPTITTKTHKPHTR